MDEIMAALIRHRIAHIRKLHEEHVAKYHFENGYRAGLQVAVLALDGRNLMGDSIDPPDSGKAKRRGK